MQMGDKNDTSENNSLTWNRARLQDAEPERLHSVYLWMDPGCHRQVANDELKNKKKKSNLQWLQFKCSPVMLGSLS